VLTSLKLYNESESTFCAYFVKRLSWNFNYLRLRAAINDVKNSIFRVLILSTNSLIYVYFTRMSNIPPPYKCDVIYGRIQDRKRRKVDLEEKLNPIFPPKYFRYLLRLKTYHEGVKWATTGCSSSSWISLNLKKSIFWRFLLLTFSLLIFCVFCKF